MKEIYGKKLDKHPSASIFKWTKYFSIDNNNNKCYNSDLYNEPIYPDTDINQEINNSENKSESNINEEGNV
jgi:hypothetical protein